VCASRGRCSNTTDAAMVKGMSVCRDSDDASVASASVSISASVSAFVVTIGGDGDEEDIVVRVGESRAWLCLGCEVLEES
jgi:hypothetical protein